MNTVFELVLVGIIVLTAALYLYRSLRPRRGAAGGCSCGQNRCPVPKPKLENRKP
jgi:hypothetical protein